MKLLSDSSTWTEVKVPNKSPCARLLHATSHVSDKVPRSTSLFDCCSFPMEQILVFGGLNSSGYSTMELAALQVPHQNPKTSTPEIAYSPRIVRVQAVPSPAQSRIAAPSSPLSLTAQSLTLPISRPTTVPPFGFRSQISPSRRSQKKSSQGTYSLYSSSLFDNRHRCSFTKPSRRPFTTGTTATLSPTRSEGSSIPEYATADRFSKKQGNKDIEEFLDLLGKVSGFDGSLRDGTPLQAVRRLENPALMKRVKQRNQRRVRDESGMLCFLPMSNPLVSVGWSDEQERPDFDAAWFSKRVQRKGPAYEGKLLFPGDEHCAQSQHAAEMLSQVMVWESEHFEQVKEKKVQQSNLLPHVLGMRPKAEALVAQGRHKLLNRK